MGQANVLKILRARTCNSGSNYTSVPAVNITGGGGSGAAATATIVPTGQTLTWDVENRLTATSDGTSFVYDGDGNRVKKTVGSTTTIYVNKYYEKTGSTITTSYYLGNKLIAIKEGDTLRYVHQDSLTSTSAMSNSSGILDSSINYLPFGLTRSGSVNTDRKFTGQRLDSTGLYYYNARYYDPSIGRFISADSLVQIASTLTDMQLSLAVSYSDTNILLKLNQAHREGNYYTGGPLDTQLLNRYSYARNNPLKYNDSSGHWIWAVVGGLVGGLVGLGAYALTHHDNFNWGQAAIWAGGGALIGATLGLAAPYIAPWAASTVTAAGTAATAVGLKTFQVASQYGIQAYNQLTKLTTGTGLRVHHLIEQRFSGLFNCKAGDIPSIVLTKEEHQMFTNAWRNAIAYIDSANPLRTNTATLQDIWNVCQDVYRNQPEILSTIKQFMNNYGIK